MSTLELAGLVRDMDEATYHSRPELSSTEARLILESAARYRYKKDHPPLVSPSKKFDIGSAVHSLVLGTGYEAVLIPEELLASNGAISTTAAKEFVEATRAAGKIPLKADDFEPIRLMGEAVMAHPTARALLSQPGSAEASVFATVDDVPVRARFDFLPEQTDRRRVSVDLKSTIDASKRAFEAAVARYGYFIQRGFYLDVLNAVTGPMPSGLEPEMLFIAAEKTPPYLVGVYQVPSVWAAKGHQAAAKARRIYAECMASGVWPGLPEEVQFLDEPTWHVYQFEEDNPDV